MAPDTRRAVDAAALARAVRRHAAAPEPPWLHGEVARRMAERLPVVKLKPTSLIDWWSASGASGELLRAAYPKARVWRVEAAPSRVPAAAPWWQPFARRMAQPVAPDEVPPGAAQLVWANMVLHAVFDPGALMAQWRRALAIDGFLMLSTLGPDTLRTLRDIYRDAGWGAAHAPFTDMHDLGDMLVGAGFADPVMDQERLTLTWATPEALLGELRGLGVNADPARFAGLRTPRWRTRLLGALRERAGADGRIALEFELVYGHAFNPPPRIKLAGETRVGLDELRSMARSGRRAGT